MSTPLRIALAGAGAFGQKHLDALRLIDGVEVVSLISRDLDKTRETAAKYGIDHATTELDEALARDDVDAVILWNERDQVTESTDANLVVELDGRRWTPPVDAGLLAGTFRAQLLASGEVAERRLSRADVSRAPRLWLVNSVRGWMDAVLVE